MTEVLALEIAREKMRDLGLKRKSYLIRYKHLRIPQQSETNIKGANDIIILLEVPKSITIRSKTGVYDLSDSNLNEQQYVHSGRTLITNVSSGFQDVKLLQIIPKIIKK